MQSLQQYLQYFDKNLNIGGDIVFSKMYIFEEPLLSKKHFLNLIKQPRQEKVKESSRKCKLFENYKRQRENKNMDINFRKFLSL